MEKRQIKLSKIHIFIIVLVSIIFIVFGFTRHMGKMLYESTVENIFATSKFLTSEMKQHAKWIKESMNQTIVNTQVMSEISNIGEMSFVEAMAELRTTYLMKKEEYAKKYNFWVYDCENDNFYELTRVDMDYNEYFPIRNEIVKLSKGKIENGNWKLFRFKNENYIYACYSYQGYVIGTWANENILLKALRNIDQGIKGQVNLIDISTEDREEWIHDKNHFVEYYRIFGQDEDIVLKFEVEKQSKITVILRIQYIILFLAIFLVLILLAMLYYLHVCVLKPVDHVLAMLSQYKSEKDFSKMIDKVSLKEANTILANLFRQVKRLKVELYEQELEQKRLQLDFMQMQIQPHFLINCLNIVYAMSQRGDQKSVQKMVLYMCNYYRFSSKEWLKEIPITRELQRVENYLKIQQTWKSERLTYHIRMDEKEERSKIPPLTIMTFIENAVKYGLQETDNLLIEITICTSEDKKLQILIRNSNSKFGEEVLEKLNAGKTIGEENGHHCGILNVINRLSIIYDNKAKVSLFNDDFGANIDIRIPQNIDRGQTLTEGLKE